MLSVDQALRNLVERQAAYFQAIEDVRVAFEASANYASQAGPVACIQHLVAEQCGFTRERILERDRHEAVALARMIAMKLCRDLTGLGLKTIGAEFGDYDHGTVSWACRSITNRMATDSIFAARFGSIRARVVKALETKFNHVEKAS